MYVQERVYKLGKERNEDHRLDSEMKISEREPRWRT